VNASTRLAATPLVTNSSNLVTLSAVNLISSSTKGISKSVASMPFTLNTTILTSTPTTTDTTVSLTSRNL